MIHSRAQYSSSLLVGFLPQLSERKWSYGLPAPTQDLGGSALPSGRYAFRSRSRPSDQALHALAARGDRPSVSFVDLDPGKPPKCCWKGKQFRARHESAKSYELPAPTRDSDLRSS
jgi:hypothetical protein